MTNETYLVHHGILGQKWGIRRYQNEDGSLTNEGRERLSTKNAYAKRYDTNAEVKTSKKTKKMEKKLEDLEKKKKYDVDSFDAITEDLKTKSGRTFYTVEEAKRDQKATAEKYDKKIDKLKKRLEINKKTDELNSQANITEKLLYNKATRKRAAEYIVNNSMSYEDAVSKSHKDAVRNTITMLSVIGISYLYESNK